MLIYCMIVALVWLGNPKKITGWKDLNNKDVLVVAANPGELCGGPLECYCPLVGQFHEWWPRHSVS